MSHSVIKDTPSPTDNTFVIVVGQDGSISVDQNTLDNLITLGSNNAEVSVVRVSNDEGSTVDMTLDTYQHTGIMEELTLNVDEVTRNYDNFRMDHCYTPLTSPSQKHPIPTEESTDPDLEVDDLAQTLSILEGSDKTHLIKTPVKVQKVQPKEQKTNDKLTLNKVNKIGVNKVYKSVKQVLSKTNKVINKKQVQEQVDDILGDDADDINDTDFINDTRTQKINKRNNKKRNNKLLDIKDIDTNILNKTQQKIITQNIKRKLTPGKNILLKQNAPQEPKIIDTVPNPDPIKSLDNKKPIKKDKKQHKQVIDDGIALFSTPDIIRRVGKDKSNEGPESPRILKPAKIEDRSHSDSTLDIQSKHKVPQRLSLDSKISPGKQRTSIDKKINDKHENISTIQNELLLNTENILNETTAVNLEPPVFNNLTPQDVRNIIEPNATIEALNAVIHTSDAAIVSHDQPVLNPENPMNLDGPLDIDHTILDNINADELISEDILYQVAKLVENPDLQNAIDKTLVEGSLTLDPTIQQTIQPQPTIEQNVQPIIQGVTSVTTNNTTNQQNQPQTPLLQNNKSQPRQVVRSDGRVLVLPPIEKPATRSSKKKQETDTNTPVIQRQNVQQPQNHTPKNQTKQHHQNQQHNQMIEQEMEQEIAPSDGESDSDESWNSEDDPDRLWCICKQPHNNRFMICCDTCEDWFHGKCVNVTKAMGQQMEAQGKEWMCPNCVKKLNLDTSSQIIEQKLSSPKTEKTESSNRRTSTETTSTPACIVCGTLARANSVYCSDQCILKHAQGVERDTKQTVKNQSQRIIVFERATGKCLSGSNAPSAANLKNWLKDHPGFEVVKPQTQQHQQQQQPQKNMTQSKLQLVKNSSGKGASVATVNRKGQQVGVLPHSSKQQSSVKLIPAPKINVPGMKTPGNKQLNPTTPSKKLIQTTIKSPTLTTTPAKSTKPVPSTPKIEKPIQKTPKNLKQPAIETQTQLDKTKAQENIRENVRKTLYEQLMTRLKEVNDLTLTEEEVTKLASEIELQLFKLFGDAGPKYRTKYRSLIFNIKDIKNQTLWRRICDKTLSPAQLVKLSPDDLASQELAKWREQETKHQLDMIKKSELEMLSINRTYVLKTHKGEQVMEDRINKVDDIIPGLPGADSTSGELPVPDKSDTLSEHSSSDRKNSNGTKHKKESRHSSRDRSSDKDKRSKERHSSRDRRKRSRSRDRDRSSHRSDRKRSRSRDRHHRSSHKSSRHKRDRHSIDHLDKKSKEILDSLENNKIVPPPEDRLWKHVPQQDIQVATPVDSDSDHEPTSTVTIPTPPRSSDHEESHTLHLHSHHEHHSNHDKEKEAAIIKTPRSDPRVNRTLSEMSKTESPEPPKLEETKESTPPLIENKITSLSVETKVWEGNINMIDVAKFFITLHEVSGDCNGIGSELPTTLEIVGRISPETVWDYIGKMRRSNSKMISILRLTAANMEEKMPYIALYSYLSSRNRLGVIKSTSNAVKDFYILPLASHVPVPQALLPISGPGFEEARPHLLLGIVVRAKRKRASVDILPSVAPKRTRIDTPPPIPTAPSIPKSYTPPPTRDPRLKLPVPTVGDEDEPYSPEDSDPESTPILPDMRKINKSTGSDITSLLTTDSTTLNTDLKTIKNLNASLKSFLDARASAMQSFEPFSNKFDTIPGLDVDPKDPTQDLKRKMEELDKCIEKQKEEIRNISQDIVQSGAAASMATNLSNISLPSNLQQILDSIKNIPATNTLDVQGAGATEEYTPTVPGYKTAPTVSEELTIPLMLPKLSSRTQNLTVRTPTHTPPEQLLGSTIPLQLPVAPRELQPQPPPPMDTLIPNLTLPPPPTGLPLPNINIPPPVLSSVQQMSSTHTTPTIPLNLPKIKSKTQTLSPPGTSPVIIPETKIEKSQSVLSTLSEEELIRKANEMLSETEINRVELKPEPQDASSVQDNYQKTAFKSAPVIYNTPQNIIPTKKPKLDPSQPPIPGLEDEYE